MESLRRYRIIACFTAPLHLAVAGIFGTGGAPNGRPELASWGTAIAQAHLVAAVGVVLTALWAHWFVAYRQRATAGAIGLQIAVAAAYLYFGAHVTLIDLAFNTGAGMATYLMICIMFGVLALMRPAISVPVYLLTYMVFAWLLERATVGASQLTSVRILALVAPALALMTSWINWSQYSKAVLLRRQLSRSNEAMAAQQHELAFLADHDALTGLYNRREFMRLAQLELRRASRVPGETAVIMVDLDHFKQINDRHGHPGGDAVLVATAACLQQALRVTDTLARLGGEEFIVLLPDTGREGALRVAAKLREALWQMVVVFEGTNIPVTASFGVSSLLAGTVAGERATVDTIYAAADRALYAAKQLGRDRVEYAAPEG